MTKRDQRPAPARPAPRLYLITPPVAAPEPIGREHAAALGIADIAAVLIHLAAGDDRALINCVKALAPVVQGKDAALLLNGRADLVARAGADGAHFAGIDDFNEALATLKPARIAGCGGLLTRHDAMLAGEAGADYVMFGEPDEDGQRPAPDAVLNRVDWWAELFEVPCVGYAGAPDEVDSLAAAGADFVALGPWVFDDKRGTAGVMADAAGRLIGAAVE
jgi:thiamine-phosphate pyrophosphorylase